MALILKDRVKETTTTTGTGTLTLGGAVTGYQSFSSAIGNTNTTYYAIYLDGGSEWEVGIGTVGAGTLSRDTILASSNSGSAVNFSAGSKSVWCDYPATKAVYADASNKLRVDGNPYVDFEDATGTTVAAGRMWYDNTVGSWNLGMGGGNITQQVGEELFIYGKASSAITEGQIVVKTGAVGASGVITFAPAGTGITDDQTIIGLATENIPLNGFGRITAFGVVHGIDTSAFSDGDIVWYNPSTGGLTATKPTAPNVKCEIGIITHAGSGGSGSIQVEIIHGTQLGGTDSNVQLTSPTAAQILTYSTTDSYWKNTSLASGTGISTSTNANGTLTVTNTAPDQTVSLTGAGTTSISGTYPNFTITSNDEFDGTVTSVAATAGTGISVTGSPITSSGTLTITNTAPDQVVSLTAGTGISTSGTYPSFTVTNTAPDQTVSLTAGTGISVTGTYPSFTVTNTSTATGDVVGPASATDNAIARYDGTTGKLIQNSAVTINDTTGSISFNGSAARILGNFNGATQSDRVLFQTFNGGNETQVGAIPNGGSTTAGFRAYNSSGATNSSIAILECTSTESKVTSGTVGSGTALPLTLNVVAGTGLTVRTDKGVAFAGAIDETVYAVSGTTPALSPSNGTIQTWTLSASSTPTAGTWNEGESMTLMINDGTAYTVTWTSVPVTWVGGSAPTLALTGYTVIELWKVGSTIYGAFVGSVA